MSQIFYIVFERTIQWKLKAEKFFQYLKYELRYDILNCDKFGVKKTRHPRCKISLNLRVLLSSHPCYLSYT